MRVSSAAMTSAVASTSSARSVRSRRFPSGVATTYNVPGSARNRASGSGTARPPPHVARLRHAHPSVMSAPGACRRSFAPIVARLASLALAAAAAFSVAQTPPASDVRDAPAESRGPAPAPPTVDIALVLPLESPAYARAADAVRAGFMAAADAAGARPAHRLPHGEDGVLPAFEAARAAGARVIVGPLVRDDVKIVASDGDRPALDDRAQPVRRGRRRRAPLLHVRAVDRERCAPDRAPHARRPRRRRGGATASRRDHQHGHAADEALRGRVRRRMDDGGRQRPGCFRFDPRPRR